MLRIEHLHKRYGAVRALDDVSLQVAEHEIVGLLGENGAGKSTLLKILAGNCRPDGGRILLRGEEVRLDSPRVAAAAGIGIAMQEQSLLPNLSVAENVMLGHEGAALRGGFYDWARLHALAAARLRTLEADIDPCARTETLSFAERQMVELARAFAIEERGHQAPLILLDEPTATLGDGQRRAVLAAIQRSRGRASVLLVSHRIEELMQLCERIYVLAEGRVAAERRRGGCTVAELQQLMFDPSTCSSAQPPTETLPHPGRVVLSVRGLRRAGQYQPVDFDVRSGEVLGLAGMVGSGREGLCRTLFGLEPPDGGQMLLDGRPVRWRGPADAVRSGVGYVPVERGTEGLVGEMSVAENMTLAHLEEVSRGPFIARPRERALVARWVEQLRLKATHSGMPAQRLSGGNQQKLVLAKWLLSHRLRVLLLDHPCRGLDVGARAEAVAAIRSAARAGVAIVLVADLSEDLVGLSDRLLVMKAGMATALFDCAAARPSDAQVLECMS
jgi:ribose transport system ATP-binding protein